MISKSDGILVKFDKKMIRQALHLAEVRGKKDNNRNDFVGACGEIAVSKVLGVGINDACTPRGDGGFDHITSTGVKIDTKTRTQEGRDFVLFRESADLWRADVGVLCWWCEAIKSIFIVGWIHKMDLIVHGGPMKIGKNKRWGIMWKRLEPISALKQRIKELEEIEKDLQS